MFCAMETPRSFFNPRTDAFYPPDAAHHHGQQAPPPPSSAYNSYPRTMNSYDDHLYPPSSQPAPPWHNDHLVPAAATQTASVTRHASSSSASSSPGLGHNHHSQDPYDSSTPSPPPSAPTSLSSSAMSGQPVQKTYSFIPLQGNAVRKRPRRRYDEIERLYSCNFPGCSKSYGTLNHLNAHVTMQKHGEKRSPNEFKEMRKQWRKQKKDEQDRAAAEATYASLVAAGNAPELTINTTPPSAQRIVTASLAASASLASPLSLGYPSPNDYSPVDSDVGGHHSVHTPPQHVPRRMSLPNLALGLDAGSQQQQQPQHHHHHQHSPQSYHHLPPAGMALPSLSLSTAAAAGPEYWRSADSDAPSSASSAAGYPVPTRSPADYPRSAVHDAYRDPAGYRHEYVPQSAPPHQVAFSHSVHHPSLPDPVAVPHQDEYAHAHPAVRDPYIHLGGHHDE